MKKYFLDTNILISGLIWDGNERRILDLALNGQLKYSISQYLLDELSRILASKFHFSHPEIIDIAESLVTYSEELLEPEYALVSKFIKELSDPNDAEILAAAFQSDSILVTGDKKLAEEAKKFVKVIFPADLLKDFSP